MVVVVVVVVVVVGGGSRRICRPDAAKGVSISGLRCAKAPFFGTSWFGRFFFVRWLSNSCLHNVSGVTENIIFFANSGAFFWSKAMVTAAPSLFPQRSQYPLIKEYTFNHHIKASIA